MNVYVGSVADRPGVMFSLCIGHMMSLLRVGS